MDVLRGSEPVTLYVAAIEAQGGVESLSDLIEPQKGLIGPLGIFVVDLNKSIVDALPHLRSSSGVIVAGKVDYTPPIDADLSVGDAIRSINGISLTGTEHFRSELERLKTGDPAVLEIERQGTYQYVTFEKE